MPAAGQELSGGVFVSGDQRFRKCCLSANMAVLGMLFVSTHGGLWKCCLSAHMAVSRWADKRHFPSIWLLLFPVVVGGAVCQPLPVVPCGLTRSYAGTAHMAVLEMLFVSPHGGFVMG
jgi:hypothetical protein